MADQVPHRAPQQAPPGPRAPRFLAIVDVAVCAHRGVDPLGLVATLADAGCPAILFRARREPIEEVVVLARAAFKLCAHAGTTGLFAGPPGGACPPEADGRHLRAADLDEAHSDSPARWLIGGSAHDLDDLRRFDARGADYVTLSPVFSTPSKPGTAPLGLTRFASLCRAARRPVLALGGVTPASVPDLIAAGAHGVAALHPLCGTDARAVLASYLIALRRAQAGPNR